MTGETRRLRRRAWGVVDLRPNEMHDRPPTSGDLAAALGDEAPSPCDAVVYFSQSGSVLPLEEATPQFAEVLAATVEQFAQRPTPSLRNTGHMVKLIRDSGCPDRKPRLMLLLWFYAATDVPTAEASDAEVGSRFKQLCMRSVPPGLYVLAEVITPRQKHGYAVGQELEVEATICGGVPSGWTASDRRPLGEALTCWASAEKLDVTPVKGPDELAQDGNIATCKFTVVPRRPGKQVLDVWVSRRARVAAHFSLGLQVGVR